METASKRIAEAKQRLADADPTDYLALSEIQQQIAELESRLEELELVWLEASEELGE